MPRCRKLPGLNCCETGSSGPRAAARTSPGSYRPKTAAASATGNCATSSAGFAAFLRARGLGRNDRVALLANNSIEHLLCYFGVMAAGATVCTVHIEMNRNQLGNIFERLKPRLILYQDGLQLDDLLAATAVPRLRLGRWDKPEPARCSPSLRICRRASRKARRSRTMTPSSCSPRAPAPRPRVLF